MDTESYARLIRDHVAHGKLAADNTETTPMTVTSTAVAPVTQVQVPSQANIETPSVIMGVPSSPAPSTHPRSPLMAIITLSGATTAASMASGPNTLMHQLMSNASTRSANTTGPQHQTRHANHLSYRIATQEHHMGCMGALVDSGANGGMAGMDTRVLATVPHAHVDITSLGGSILKWLPLIQCASVVDTVDEGKIVLIMSQYAHKPDSKTLHSKSQIESFGSLVHDSAVSAGGHQVIVTHEGYVIPLHVRNGLCYMDMYSASNSDLDQYTHVFLTSDTPWNPDIVDDEFFFDASNSLLSVPSVQEWRDARDPRVDATGEMYFLDLHSHDQPITQECHSFVLDALKSLSQSIKQCLPDLDALLPNFGWVGKDRIQTTLENTSQHYMADQQIPMQKYFRS